MRARTKSFFDEVTRLLSPGARILEIGAGDGELAVALATAGYDVLAMDREQRSTFPTLVTDFELWNPQGTQFDCVVAALVLHHLANLERTLRKIRSLLKIGGLVAIDDYGWERLNARMAREQWGDAWEQEASNWTRERVQLHRSDIMLAALDRDFQRLLYRDHAYFQEGLGSDALAFTYIGR